MHRNLGYWKVDVLEVNFMRDSVKQILATPLSLFLKVDQYTWHLESFEEYIVKLGYKPARNM